MDLDDHVRGLAKDPLGPERPVQLALGDAQEGVSEGDGHQDAGVEKCRVPRKGYSLAGRARRRRADFSAVA
jgi:hypothetical protein